MKRYFTIALMLILTAFIFPSCGQQEAELSYYDRMTGCREQLEKLTDFRPDVAILLGSGVSNYVDSLDIISEIPYSDIEGWPVTDSPGSGNKLILAEKYGLKLAIMQGRPHYFDGFSGAEIVLPLRVLHLLGADTVIMSSTAGAINKSFHVGDFVCVRDHISSFIESPLEGENIDEFGDRFVDMTSVYDEDMRKEVFRICEDNGIPVHSGTYLQVTGPQYETPAEIEMYRKLGADTVSMNDVADAIAARQMGMRICTINYISNMAAGIEEGKIDHNSVVDNAEKSKENIRILMDGLLEYLASQS